MGFRNLLLAATLASSQLASGSDAPTVQNAQHSTSQKSHDVIGHDKHQKHPHIEVSAGFEHNHLLPQGQLMEGNFSSLGIHASLGNWGAYYHWLQAQESSLEHKGGITYSHPLNNGFTLTTGLSGVYEVTSSEHGSDHHPEAPEDTSSYDPHHKEEPKHHTPEKHEPVLEPTLYIAATLEAEAILQQNTHSKTTLTAGGEYDFGSSNTFFLHAGVRHKHDIGRLQLMCEAKVIEVLKTDSTHLETGTLGVLGVGAKLPLGSSNKWHLNLGGQMTTHGDMTGMGWFSRSF